MLGLGMRCFGGLCALCVLVVSLTSPAHAAGVTVITHGLNSGVTNWIIPMSSAMPGYPGFPGTSASHYTVSITRSGGVFSASATLISGVSPMATDSGEIFVNLDWSSLDGFFQASTSDVANAAVDAFLDTTLIPELAGRPLAELPLHLSGHSRGASVSTEMARFFGAQGIWVNQVTTMDPRPIAGDGDVVNWSNVLFADNYWQDEGDGFFVPNGDAVSGAYNRQLPVLSGGNSSNHSDVHLWYHGTIDLNTPAGDLDATITMAERATWWTATESNGAAAGFFYSRMGGGDWLASVEPAGAGTGPISDGFNRYWPLGGVGLPNRTALPVYSGAWPNPIRLELGAVSTIAAGNTFAAMLYYQAGTMDSGTVDCELLLDPDFNPFNANEMQVHQQALPKTGTSSVSSMGLSARVDAATVFPGTYAVHIRLTDGTNKRYHTAPGTLVVTPSLDPPSIDTSLMVYDGTDIRITVHGFPGQVVTMEVSDDLIDWTPVETHTFTGTIWEFVDEDVGDFDRRFYRGVLVP